MRVGPLKGPSIGRLLLGVNLFVLLVPVVAVVLLRIYEQHLVHQTEGRLIAEAALIGEAWRSHLLLAQGRPDTAAGRIQPPDARDARFFPYDPVIDLHAPVAAAEVKAPRVKPADDSPPWRAGRAIKPLLDRSKLVNLSGARVLDTEGCVVASTAEGLGECLDHLPEVKTALTGRYHAVARPRDDERRAPTSLSRSGDFRVFVALPLFSDGQVIGVVRMSRTTLDVPQALWPYREVLLWASIGCLVLTALLSLFLSRTLVRPVRAITAAAEAIARGDAGRAPQGRVPAEVFQLHAALSTMTNRLNARAAAVAEFAGNVSHELKTPLTSVRGAVELLRDDWREMDEAQRERFLANIDHDAERMQRLITRLLELARIEHAPPESREISVASTLTDLVTHHGGRVQLDLAGAPATVRLPPEHLTTAVGNLVENALRHSEGPVEVKVRGAGNRLEVRVTDHGPGISEKNRARIFDRFFTTERDRGGTGLGLAIVHAIARSRGGSIECEKSGPEGTTFRLVL